MAQEEFGLDRSALIEKTVKYSVKKDVTSTGVVMDKILAREKATDEFATTKYLIEDDTTGEIVCIAAWRVLKVYKDNEEAPTRNLQGGYQKRA